MVTNMKKQTHEKQEKIRLTPKEFVDLYDGSTELTISAAMSSCHMCKCH